MGMSTKVYYLTYEEDNLYLQPDGTGEGYIITNDIVDSAMFKDYHSTYMIGTDLELLDGGWVIKETYVTSTGSIPRAKEKDLIDSLKK